MRCTARRDNQSRDTLLLAASMKAAAAIGLTDKVVSLLDAVQAGQPGNGYNEEEQQEFAALSRDVEVAAQQFADPIPPEPQHESDVGESPCTLRARVQRRSDPEHSGAVADLGVRLAAAASYEQEGAGTGRSSGQPRVDLADDVGIDGDGFGADVGGDEGIEVDGHAEGAPECPRVPHSAPQCPEGLLLD